MNRLRKVIESSLSGDRTGRVAFVLRPETLPAPHTGFEWRDDATFSAADSVLADASLKEVFSAAVKHGHAIVGHKQP